MYSLVVFSFLQRDVARSILGHFHQPKKKPCALELSLPYIPKPPPRHLPVPSATSLSLSVSLSFPVPSFPTNAVPSMLSSRLASFPPHEAFGARPSHSRAPGFIPLWGCIIARGVRAPHWFALSWARGHLGRVHLLAVTKDAVVSVPAQVFVWTNGFVSLGSAPRSRSSPSHASGVFRVLGTAAPFDAPTGRALASGSSTSAWPPALGPRVSLSWGRAGAPHRGAAVRLPDDC